VTPEGKVKAKLRQGLDALDVYYFSPATHGYGRSGVPDIVACAIGLFFAFECKAGRNKPTELQQAEIEKINAAGGRAIVVNETNVEATLLHMEMILGRQRNGQRTGRPTGTATASRTRPGRTRLHPD